MNINYCDTCSKKLEDVKHFKTPLGTYCINCYEKIKQEIDNSNKTWEYFLNKYRKSNFYDKQKKW